MKFVFPLTALLALALSACNTIENRRSLYSPTKANGPYTHSLQDGSWKERKSVDEQYAQAQKEKKQAPKTSAPAPEAPPAAPPGT